MQNILVQIAENIATITINRPEKLNALNNQTIEELGAAIADLSQNEAVRGIIITGAGEKAFVAGADIMELAACGGSQAQALARKGQALVFDAIENLNKPVIAAVNGFALGGGCELAMACHLRIATQNAKFGQPEVNLGTIPGYGGTQRLAQLIGKAKALELLMTADMVDATQALQLGLINHIAETQAELLQKCTEILLKISTKAPTAIAQIIRSVNSGYQTQGYQTEIEAFGTCAQTQDFVEGTTAFLQKRKAQFTGK